MLHEMHLPEDIRNLKPAQCRVLAEEVRQELIRTVSQTGGHLASNLGVVELTIAMHSVFSSPKDRFVFDVGHQAYVHKILTGRLSRFSSLRQKDGLSGFPSAAESEHDAFTAGHASTAISAAIGLARARDLRGEDHHVVAVVGDGALTGGLSYEALNDAGDTRVIIIMNDNEMSIARNVGSLSVHLANMRQSASYLHAKSAIRGLLEKIPALGKPVIRMIERMRDTLKTILVSDRFFESLGINYVGPIDGHNLRALVKGLKIAKHSTRPVVLHVVTQKGHGYIPAQEHPEEYHGLPSQLTSKKLGHSSTGAAAAELLSRLAIEDGRICSVVAAMPTGTAMKSFFQQYPKRSFDVGIAEEHAVEMAAGLAAGGMRPFVAVYSTFLQRAVDQILMDVCLPNLPVTFLLDRAGLVGEDGATHQGVFDLTYLRQMPGMTIAAPSNLEDLRRMIAYSLQQPGPVAIRYPKSLPEAPAAPFLGKPKQAQVLTKGKDAAILALGPLVEEALQAAAKLLEQGIQATVVDVRFVKPLDEDTLTSVLSAVRAAYTLEENTVAGGLGSAILELAACHALRLPIHPMGVPDRFIYHASVEQQREECALTADHIAKMVFETLPNTNHQSKPTALQYE